MGLGGEINDGVRAGANIAHYASVGNGAMGELKAERLLQVGKIGRVTGVGERVEYVDMGVRVLT